MAVPVVTKMGQGFWYSTDTYPYIMDPITVPAGTTLMLVTCTAVTQASAYPPVASFDGIAMTRRISQADSPNARRVDLFVYYSPATRTGSVSLSPGRLTNSTTLAALFVATNLSSSTPTQAQSTFAISAVSVSTNLGAAANANNRPFMACTHLTRQTPDATAGWIELYEIFSTTELFTQFNPIAYDTTITASGTGTGNYAGFAFELNTAPKDLSELVDPFDGTGAAFDTSMWKQVLQGTTMAKGRATFVASTSAAAGLVSSETMSFSTTVSGAVFVRVRPAMTPSLGRTQMVVYSNNSVNAYIYYDPTNNTLFMRNTPTVWKTLTYDPVTMAYWRIRVDGPGVQFWFGVSPDGLTWTEYAGPGFSTGAARLEIHTLASAVPGTSEWEGVNVTSAVPLTGMSQLA